MTDNTATPTLGEFLRALRKARGVGLVELAHLAGIDPGLLSRFENGRRVPTNYKVLQQIGKGLGINERSEEFQSLVGLLNRARLADAGMLEALMEQLKKSNPSDEEPEGVEPVPVFCADFAELLARTTHYAITTGATVITVRSADGAVQRFQLLPPQKPKKVTKQ